MIFYVVDRIPTGHGKFIISTVHLVSVWLRLFKFNAFDFSDLWYDKQYITIKNEVIATLSPLREEIFAGINFREFFFGHFAGINFREFGFTEDFAGINVRELSLSKDFAGINFRESALVKVFAGP